MIQWNANMNVKFTDILLWWKEVPRPTWILVINFMTKHWTMRTLTAACVALVTFIEILFRKKVSNLWPPVQLYNSQQWNLLGLHFQHLIKVKCTIPVLSHPLLWPPYKISITPFIIVNHYTWFPILYGSNFDLKLTSNSCWSQQKMSGSTSWDCMAHIF